MLLLILKLLAHSSSDGRGRKELLTLCFLGNVSRQLLLSLRGLLGQRPRTKQKKLWYQQHLSLLRFVSYINLSESCRKWCNYPLDHNSELYSDVECCLQAGFPKENDKLGQKAVNLFFFCFVFELFWALCWTELQRICLGRYKPKGSVLISRFLFPYVILTGVWSIWLFQITNLIHFDSWVHRHLNSQQGMQIRVETLMS